MVASSAAVGVPIRMPQAYSRSVPPPRNDPTLGETPRRSSAPSQSPNRDQLRIRSGQPGGASGCSSGGAISPPNGAGV